MDPLAAWTEWRQRCALGLCGARARSVLQEFARARFANYLVKYAHRTSIPDHDAARLTPADPWHLFESYLALRSARSGKRYKDWLFARADLAANPLLDAVQGGATLLLRDVVRDYLRRECPPPGTFSLHEPQDDEDAPLTAAELLPDETLPTAEAERREWETLADQHARELAGQLGPRERIALVARELGIPLSHPVPLQLAGCRRSMLDRLWRRLFYRLAHQLRRRYPDDDPPAIRQLTILTVAAVSRIVLAQSRLEIAHAPLFLLVESAAVPGAQGRLASPPAPSLAEREVEPPGPEPVEGAPAEPRPR